MLSKNRDHILKYILKFSFNSVGLQLLKKTPVSLQYQMNTSSLKINYVLV